MKALVVNFFLVLLVGVSWAQTTPPPTVANQAGKEAVCEGALEIIPSGTMAFTRKRYVPKPRKAKAQLAKPRSPGRR